VMGQAWRQLEKGSLSLREPKLVAKLDKVGGEGKVVLHERGFFRFFALLEKLEKLIASRHLRAEYLG